MGVPQTKSELLNAMDKNFSKLIGYLDAIPSELVSEKSMEGHAKDTMMSVRDLISYLLGWNMLVIKWITNDDKGESVDFPETGYKWNQLGLLAQKFYKDYEGVQYVTLIQDLKLAKENIVALINARDDNVLYGKPWYGKWTMGRMISFNTSSPYANACGRLRKWAKEYNVRLK